MDTSPRLLNGFYRWRANPMSNLSHLVVTFSACASKWGATMNKWVRTHYPSRFNPVWPILSELVLYNVVLHTHQTSCDRLVRRRRRFATSSLKPTGGTISYKTSNNTILFYPLSRLSQQDLRRYATWRREREITCSLFHHYSSLIPPSCVTPADTSGWCRQHARKGVIYLQYTSRKGVGHGKRCTDARKYVTTTRSHPMPTQHMTRTGFPSMSRVWSASSLDAARVGQARST